MALVNAPLIDFFWLTLGN